MTQRAEMTTSQGNHREMLTKHRIERLRVGLFSDRFCPRSNLYDQQRVTLWDAVRRTDCESDIAPSPKPVTPSLSGTLYPSVTLASGAMLRDCITASRELDRSEKCPMVCTWRGPTLTGAGVGRHEATLTLHLMSKLRLDGMSYQATNDGFVI